MQGLNINKEFPTQIITTEALIGLTQMVSDLTGLYANAKSENEKLKEKLLLTPEEVAERTPWTAKTIRAKKFEIGYVAMGKDICFEPENVERWIIKYRVPARDKKK